MKASLDPEVKTDWGAASGSKGVEQDDLATHAQIWSKGKKNGVGNGGASLFTTRGGGAW